MLLSLIVFHFSASVLLASVALTIFLLSRLRLCQKKQLPRYLFIYSSQQSVTSRLETSRYRDFFQFFDSIGLEKFGLKKVSVSVSKTFGLEKSLGIGLE